MPLGCFEDELPNKVFDFNEVVESPMKESFISEYKILFSQMFEFDTQGYFYIKSNVSERKEGMVIYGLQASSEIDIFYLASIRKEIFSKILDFVVQKLYTILGISTIRIRIRHILSSNKRYELDPFMRAKLKESNFKVKAIVNSPSTSYTYTVFEKTHGIGACILQRNQPSFRFYMQVTISDDEKISCFVKKQLKKNSVDFRIVIFLAFLFYIKGFNKRKHLIGLMTSFDKILDRFEKNKNMLKKVTSDKNLLLKRWKYLVEYSHDIEKAIGSKRATALDLNIPEAPNQKEIRLSACVIKLTASLKFCDSTTLGQASRYYRIKQNSETYMVISKKLRQKIYILPCTNKEYSICIMPNSEFLLNFLASKHSYSTLSQGLFEVLFL